MFSYYLFYASVEKLARVHAAIAATAIMAEGHRGYPRHDHEAAGADRLLLARKR
jgi:hypothetical protein